MAEAEADVQVCPGCGGRNVARADVCDWCARSFSGRSRSFRVGWWPLTAALLLGGTAAAVVALTLLNAGRPEAATPMAGAEPTPSPTLPAAPTPSGARPPALSPPALTATAPAAGPAAANPPADAPTPEPAPPRYARVVNTNGLGVNLRREPGPQGQPLLAVSESAILRVLGPEETVQARVWRLCEHQARGVQGWVPAEYLQHSDQGPTPGRP